MGPKFGAQSSNKLGSQLGPMSITKLSPNWACQMGPIHCPKFLLPGMAVGIAVMFMTASDTQSATRFTTAIWLVGHSLPSIELLNQLPRVARFFVEYIMR